jgi:hypothetical protein
VMRQILPLRWIYGDEIFAHLNHPESLRGLPKLPLGMR